MDISVRRWVIPRARPNAPCRDDKRMIHGQCANSRPPDFSQPNYRQAVLAPNKMLGPNTLARIEKRRYAASYRIQRLSSAALAPIARRACQSKIFRDRLPACRQRYHVINFKWDAAQSFVRSAIFATRICPRHDFGLQCRQDAGRCHARSNSRGG